MTTIDRLFKPVVAPVVERTPLALTLGYSPLELTGAQHVLECRGDGARGLLTALTEARAQSAELQRGARPAIARGAESHDAGHAPAADDHDTGHDLEHHAHSVKESLHALEHVGGKGSQALQAADDLVRGAISGEVARDLATHHVGHHDGLGSRVIGGLGVAGGAVQVGVGVHELAAGDVVHGVKDVATGSAYAGAGTLELAGAATSVAGGLAGAGALIDGAVNLWDGYQSVDLGKTVSGGSMAVGGGVLLGVAIGVVTAPAAAIAGGTLVGGAVVYNAYRHFTDHE
jgi:hypothetical protein